MVMGLYESEPRLEVVDHSMLGLVTKLISVFRLIVQLSNHGFMLGEDATRCPTFEKAAPRSLVMKESTG